MHATRIFTFPPRSRSNRHGLDWIWVAVAVRMRFPPFSRSERSSELELEYVHAYTRFAYNKTASRQEKGV